MNNERKTVKFKSIVANVITLKDLKSLTSGVRGFEGNILHFVFDNVRTLNGKRYMVFHHIVDPLSSVNKEGNSKFCYALPVDDI